METQTPSTRPLGAMITLILLLFMFQGALGASQLAQLVWTKSVAPTRIVVEFFEEYVPADQVSLIKGTMLLKKIGSRNAFAVEITDGSAPEEKVAAFAGMPSVAAARPDYVVSIAAQAAASASGGAPAIPSSSSTAAATADELSVRADDPYFPGQQNLRMIDVPGAWAAAQAALVDADAEAGSSGNSTSTGGGSRKDRRKEQRRRRARTALVCLPDSGVDALHLELRDAVHPTLRRDELQGRDGEAEDDTRGSHGTLLAGVVAATGNNAHGIAGVHPWAPLVQVLPCKFIGAGGTGLLSDATNCLQWCREHGAMVALVGWGAPGARSVDFGAELAQYGAAGGVVFAAAGNAGDDNDDPATAFFPASYDSDAVVAVGAFDRSGSIASWTNLGRKTVQFLAPGQDVLGPVRFGGFTAMNGTSAAAAHAAGVAALALTAAGGKLDGGALREALVQSVDDLGGAAGVTVMGGKLNARNAIEAALELAESLPPAPAPVPTPNDAPAPAPAPTRDDAAADGDKAAKVPAPAPSAAADDGGDEVDAPAPAPPQQQDEEDEEGGKEAPELPKDSAWCTLRFYSEPNFEGLLAQQQLPTWHAADDNGGAACFAQPRLRTEEGKSLEDQARSVSLVCGCTGSACAAAERDGSVLQLFQDRIGGGGGGWDSAPGSLDTRLRCDSAAEMQAAEARRGQRQEEEEGGSGAGAGGDDDDARAAGEGRCRAELAALPDGYDRGVSAYRACLGGAPPKGDPTGGVPAEALQVMPMFKRGGSGGSRRRR